MSKAVHSKWPVVPLILVVTAMMVVFLPPPKAQAYNCPTGWLSATNGVTMPNITVFCYWPGTGGGIGGDNIHLVKANVGSVGQYTRNPANPSDLWNYRGNASNPNPLFLKKSVRDHLMDYQGSGVKMVINGSFYKCTGEIPPSNADPSCGGVSELSFPTWRVGNSLVNTGFHVMTPRHCFAFGNGYVPASYLWTNNSTTWNWVSAATGYCGSGSPYHRVVGASPTWGPVQDDARTYIARDLGPNPDQVCFLVGGFMRQQAAVQALASVGCNNPVQMDGGNSSQLSYVHPVLGYVVSPVDGKTIQHRKVPHYFVIFG